MDEMREKTDRREIYEDELRILIYSFAYTISRTAKKLFKRKELLDDAFIDYFKVETISFGNDSLILPLSQL
jgi:hypothetical protein